MASLIPRASKRLRLSTPSPCRFLQQPRCATFSSTTCLADQHQHHQTPHTAPRQPIESTKTTPPPPTIPQPKTPHTPPPQDKTTHFGFTTVAESLKESKVANVFSSVASSYDTMNDLMSLGIHRLWKDHFVRDLNPGGHLPGTPQSGWHILDIAGGSGDIAFRLLDHATNINHDTKTHVTISDINADMLAEGRKRAAASPYAGSGRLDFVQANAEDLHMIPDSSIDLYTVSFGIRNFTRKSKALEEAYRVLKPGGVFACLEFSKVQNPVFDFVYKRWSFAAIPLIGQVVAGDRDSYQYLVESIEKFPTQEEWRDMIAEAGFLIPGGAAGDGKGWEDLTNGIAAIHKGVKPLK